ncbi:MAG: iron-sulfur cluster assembly scaffold protein [Deltaproteobacteria bacterium]|nr:iron-sulfur cluster assembly scaffold protein [Deltaproteobacteria bacterium]
MKEIVEFNFWNDHSRNYLEMAYRTDKQEKRQGYPFTGKNIGDCGDMVEIYLDIDKKNIIRNIAYNVEGCLNTNACANTICLLAEGKNTDDAWDITPGNIIDFLETLPPANYHCAELAAGAFYRALNTIKPDKKG